MPDGLLPQIQIKLILPLNKIYNTLNTSANFIKKLKVTTKSFFKLHLSHTRQLIHNIKIQNSSENYFISRIYTVELLFNKFHPPHLPTPEKKSNTKILLNERKYMIPLKNYPSFLTFKKISTF